MKKEELETLVLVLDELENIIYVSRKNAWEDYEFVYNYLLTCLMDVLNVLKSSTEAHQVSDLLNKVSKYYISLEERDDIEGDDSLDKEDIKRFLKEKDDLISDFEGKIGRVLRQHR
jgi:hypothetical protein